MNINIDFDSLKEKAKDLAQTGVAKAKELTDSAIDKSKELTEIGKLKVQNASEQEAIKKAYLELGKLYYAERGLAPDAAYATLCQQITDSKGKIAYNNERIGDIKSAGKAPEDQAEDADFCCQAQDETQAPAEDCGCHCDGAQDEDKPEE